VLNRERLSQNPTTGLICREQSPDGRFNQPCRIAPRHIPRTASVAPALGPFFRNNRPSKKPQALAHCGSPGSKIEWYKMYPAPVLSGNQPQSGTGV
jgi:hypothetical protein